MAGGYSSDGPIEPIHRADPKRAIEAYQDHERDIPETTHVRRMMGRVVSVHEKSGHHEGGHLLDESVGAQAYNEIVIRVPSGDLGHLVGRRVSVRIEADE